MFSHSNGLNLFYLDPTSYPGWHPSEKKLLTMAQHVLKEVNLKRLEYKLGGIISRLTFIMSTRAREYPSPPEGTY